MSAFSSIDFGMLQRVAFPLIESLGGPDVSDIMSTRAPAFRTASELLSDYAAMLDVVAQAMDDGILDNVEINAIVEAAPDAGAAYDTIWNLISTGSPLDEEVE